MLEILIRKEIIRILSNLPDVYNEDSDKALNLAFRIRRKTSADISTCILLSRKTGNLNKAVELYTELRNTVNSDYINNKLKNQL